uniref:BolA-like protein 2 n=1 Tax=Chelonoidis abingdonii TaxID=106734 RepID=A0A8C0INK9_CHEAB
GEPPPLPELGENPGVRALSPHFEDTTPSRCSTSFKVLVVSSRFRGKPLLQRHRLVNELLAEDLKHIHAFEQRTLTPEQWEKERGGLQ